MKEKSFIYEKIIEIRKRWEKENITREQLAKEYGMSLKAISRITNNKAWNHLK